MNENLYKDLHGSAAITTALPFVVYIEEEIQ